MDSPADAITGSLTERILDEHTASRLPGPGESVGLEVDQILLQDVLGPLSWIEFEALGFDEVQCDVVAQYADHQVLQIDAQDTDTHRFLRTVTRRYGGHYSKVGNGICHQVHREQFIAPGKTLLGGDSHVTTMGGFGALGIGAGGLDVALAMGGEPYQLDMPEVVNVRLTGELPPWSSAKDVILEMLRRYSVKGGVGKVYEFTGPGVDALSVPERCTIANMTTELGATSGLFPSDERTKRHLQRLGRPEDYRPLEHDPDARYDDRIELDLSTIEPLVATPSMPDNVVPASEVSGTSVDQVLVGTCTNGSYFDLATVADVVAGNQVAENTDFIVNPASKRSVELLARTGELEHVFAAGVNVSESTCGPCIGQGHIPAPDSVSLRAFNRNFKGRSGYEDDHVYLCSPEVAAASGLAGEIIDPRETDYDPPAVTFPTDMTRATSDVLDPDPNVTIERGETIGEIPLRDPIGTDVSGPVLGVFQDDVTTDHIMPATASVMSLWSDPEASAEYALSRLDENFPERARESEGGWIIAGENYGQGSSRENAAIALAVLGVDGVIAKSFARIHRDNLVNFGVIPLTFATPASYDRIAAGDMLSLEGEVGEAIAEGQHTFEVTVNHSDSVEAILQVDGAEDREVLAAGGKLPHVRANRSRNNR